METTTQIFYIPEVAEISCNDDKIDEYKQLCEEVGIAAKPVSGNSPIPFQPINAKMEKMVTELCGRSCLLADFDFQPMPLEVLRVIKMAQRENYFDNIFVYWAEENPDPFVVGEKISKNYDTLKFWDDSDCPDERFKGKEISKENPLFPEAMDYFNKNPKSLMNKNKAKKYLIARWGDEAKPIQELLKTAMDLWKIRKRADLTKKIKSCQFELDNIEEEAVSLFL